MLLYILFTSNISLEVLAISVVEEDENNRLAQRSFGTPNVHTCIYH